MTEQYVEIHYNDLHYCTLLVITFRKQVKHPNIEHLGHISKYEVKFNSTGTAQSHYLFHKHSPSVVENYTHNSPHYGT